jgi:hypothetical protein
MSFISSGVRHLFSATEAEQVLGIPAATVRSWARRERIFSFGLDERDRPLYDREDLIRLREVSVGRRNIRAKGGFDGHALDQVHRGAA